jgi:antitoxin component YwqK of YwqJK toxin-antitoxin module
MKKLFLAFVPGLLFVTVASAGSKTDREGAGLIGLVQAVNSVTTLPPRVGERVLSLYDAKGNELETAFYHSPASGGALAEKSIHTYDTEGNRSATVTYSGDGILLKKTTYTYDTRSNLTEMVSSDEVGLIEKTTYTYDEKGQPTEEIVYYAHGPIMHRSVHSYDMKGNRTQSLSYTRDGSVTKTVSIYDTKGNMTTRATYATDGSLIDELTYTYEFDAIGNWIKQTESICDPMAQSGESACAPSAVISRTITYESPARTERQAKGAE